MTREFLSETQERFLKGILAQLPITQVAELYLFQPIKQGGVESGVAVIAGVPEVPAPEPGQEPGDAGRAEDAAAVANADADADADAPESEADAELEVLDDAGAGAELGVVDTEDDAASTDDDAEDEAGAEEAHRFTVYTAHYRLVLKGPDRGKWALDVKAEADAPLITIETVVRGVQQRAGDVEPPRRYEQGDIRELLRLPAEDAPTP